MEIKSNLQLIVERTIPPASTYQHVPYTRVLGEEMALKMWLMFSKYRVINLVRNPSDETNLWTYFAEYIKGGQLKENLKIPIARALLNLHQ